MMSGTEMGFEEAANTALGLQTKALLDAVDRDLQRMRRRDERIAKLEEQVAELQAALNGRNGQ
jgi:hypothetical protein